MSFADPTVMVTDRLRELAGKTLVSVTFHSGATVLNLDGNELACYEPPQVNVCRWLAKGDASWHASLIGLIGGEVSDVALHGAVVTLRVGYGQIEAKVRGAEGREIGVLKLANGEFWALR